MPDRPDVATSRAVIRAQLAQAFPGNTRLQRAFEDMTSDVSETLPDAIAAVGESAGVVLAAQSFLPPPAAAPINTGADQMILAAQVFGA